MWKQPEIGVLDTIVKNILIYYKATMKKPAKTGLVVGLLVVSAVLLCVALGLGRRASNMAFGSVLALGGAFLVSGTCLLVWLPVEAPGPAESIVHGPAPGAASAAPRSRRQPSKSILKTVATAGDQDQTRSPSSVSWSDGDSQSPLERVVEFRGEEPPVVVARMEPVDMPAHMPRPVPAVPNKLRTGYESPAVPLLVAAEPNKLRMGYESPAVPGLPGQLDAAFQRPLPPPSTGPLYYTPFTGYPSVNDMIEERIRFQNRPDTPELERHRRLGLEWEVAMSMARHPDRSGYVIPVTGPALVQEAATQAVDTETA